MMTTPVRSWPAADCGVGAMAIEIGAATAAHQPVPAMAIPDGRSWVELWPTVRSGRPTSDDRCENRLVLRSEPFVHPIAVRYLEVDQQRVVFNMWYLAYMDDAMTAFLLEGGLPYSEMVDRGCDVQLVHTEIDWRGSLTWADPATVSVSLATVGRTSFTLQFEFRSLDRVVATGRNVYVAIHPDGSGKRDVPTFLIESLGVVGPLPD